MKAIKFTTDYEKVLYVNDSDFKAKYETIISGNAGYVQKIGGEYKHFAICPRCNNPVIILGIYKKIATAPHARHAKGINLPDITNFNEYKYLNCPYHKKKANYIKEYVDETEEPERHKLYKIAKEHYDKAIYMLQEQTGIYIPLKLAEELAENYVGFRAYNYIDATIYNIPWYLIYSYRGLPLYKMIIKKNSAIYKEIKKLKNYEIKLTDSVIKDHVCIATNQYYYLTATDYCCSVDKDDNLNEWLNFSIVRPNKDVKTTRLYEAIHSFTLKVDSYHFANLIEYKGWHKRQILLDIAAKYMNP